ncbi:MAG: hypothetical protein JSS11_08070 [Verrucomicrobia bacterium]|nr:hypothetical protein [Verrucomicrobiota bacterium]
MSDAPVPPTAPLPRGPLITASVLVALGFIGFGIGMIAGIRADGPPRTAIVLGLPAWQFAAAGFVFTLAGGLWLRRLVK